MAKSKKKKIDIPEEKCCVPSKEEFKKDVEDVKIKVEVPKKAPTLSYINGKLQINKASFEVDIGEEEDGHEPKKRIGIESGKGGKKKEHCEKWSSEETEKFYVALQMFGTDFSMIESLLPKRTRKQVKVLIF